jgi:hypothetical protein
MRAVAAKVKKILACEVCSEPTMLGIVHVAYASMNISGSVLLMTGFAMPRELVLFHIGLLACSFGMITAALGLWTGQRWARYVGTAAWVGMAAVTSGPILLLMAWYAWRIEAGGIEKRRRKTASAP